MAKSHWYQAVVEDPHGISRVYGCQHSECQQAAVYQWLREATDEEVEAEHSQEGPYGAVIRNHKGPHRVSVFACKQHALPQEALVLTHAADCPAPDAGCVCHAGE